MKEDFSHVREADAGVHIEDDSSAAGAPAGHPEEVVALDLRDGTCGAVVLDGDVHLLVELEAVDISRIVSGDSSAARSVRHELSPVRVEDLEAALIGQVVEAVDVGDSLNHISVRRVGPVALLVQHKHDADTIGLGRRSAVIGGAQRQTALAVDVLDDEFAPHARVLRRALADEKLAVGDSPRGRSGDSLASVLELLLYLSAADIGRGVEAGVGSSSIEAAKVPASALIASSASSAAAAIDHASTIGAAALGAVERVIRHGPLAAPVGVRHRQFHVSVLAPFLSAVLSAKSCVI